MQTQVIRMLRLSLKLNQV